MAMNAIQTTGLILIIVGAVAALGTASMGMVSFGGSTGGGGPSGTMTIGSGNMPWISLGVAAIGVVLVVVGREQPK